MITNDRFYPGIFSLTFSMGLGIVSVISPHFVGAQEPSQGPETTENTASLVSEDHTETSLKNSANPPQIQGTKWIRVPYEKAENDLLAQLHRDLHWIEDKVMTIAVYSVDIEGNLPPGYQSTLRSKLETILLSSKKLQLKQCMGCDRGKLIKTESGEIQYINSQSNRTQEEMTETASRIGAAHLIYTKLIYTHVEMKLQVRVVEAAKNLVIWNREYSVQESIKSAERQQRWIDGDVEQMKATDSLTRVIIGELSFALSLAPSVAWLPTIYSSKYNGDQLMYPGMDIFFGERFDGGHKIFGLLMGASFTLAGPNDQARFKPLNFLFRGAPRYKYVFNPYEIVSPRYAIISEAGAMLSIGLATGYVGIGLDVSMIRRFSMSLMPIYIIPRPIGATAETLIEQKTGELKKEGENNLQAADEKMGGLGLMLNFNINW